MGRTRSPPPPRRTAARWLDAQARRAPTTAHGRWPWREVLLSAASVLIVAALLVAGEAILRLVDPDYLRREPTTGINELHRYSEVYGWEPRPGAREVVDGRRITINQRGYRGREVDRTRPGRETRLVMLGDSLAFGTEVDDEDTFARLLDRDKALEVVNLSVPGYGPDQELLKLEHEALGYRPDVVMLNLCLENDFADAALSRFLYDGVHPKPYFVLEGGQLSLHDEHLALNAAEKLALRLREDSHLYNRLLAVAAANRVNASFGGPSPDALHWSLRKEQALQHKEAAERLTVALIARMQAEAEAQGAAFLVLVHPNKLAYNRGSSWLDAVLNARALAGARTVDMIPLYRARGLRFADIAMDGIGHLSPKGHREAAAVIREVLAGMGLDHRRAAAVAIN